MNWSSAVTLGMDKMARIYTVTINGKETFICGKVTGIRVVNDNTDFYSPIDDDAIANALPGLFTASPKWSEVTKSTDALTFNLNEFAKLFGVNGALTNDCGYGHTMAKHKRTGTRIVVMTDRVGIDE
jgi:hypothetical protein